MRILIFFCILYLPFSSCKNHHSPGPTTSDTIVIKSDAVIFYYPDAASLDTLQRELDKGTFASAVSSSNHFMDKASKFAEAVRLNKITTSRGKVFKFILL